MCNSVEFTAAGREPYTRDKRHLYCKAKCCKFCTYCSRAFSKEGNKSRGSSLSCIQKQIKICEQCFLCHSIVLCKYCNKCSQCCLKSSCRGQTSKLLETLAKSGCRSEGCSNPERGLHPPLPDPATLVKNSDSISCYGNPHRNLKLLEALHQLTAKNAIELVHKQTSLGFFNRLFLVPKPNNKWRPILDLSNLNVFLKTEKFKMETPETVRTSLQQGGMGNLHRLQGCIFPHSDTGTVQEISEVSRPGTDLSIQSSPFWLIHSSDGVHRCSKRGKADGHSEGYKDPPIPRRLVGESHIPPGMSPTYPNLSENVPGPGLVSENRKVGTRPKTNLQFYCVNTSYPTDNCFTGRRDRSRQTPEKDVLYIILAGPVSSVHSLGGASYLLPVQTE